MLGGRAYAVDACATTPWRPFPARSHQPSPLPFCPRCTFPPEHGATHFVRAAPSIQAAAHAIASLHSILHLCGPTDEQNRERRSAWYRRRMKLDSDREELYNQVRPDKCRRQPPLKLRSASAALQRSIRSASEAQPFGLVVRPAMAMFSADHTQEERRPLAETMPTPVAERTLKERPFVLSAPCSWRRSTRTRTCG